MSDREGVRRVAGIPSSIRLPNGRFGNIDAATMPSWRQVLQFFSTRRPVPPEDLRERLPVLHDSAVAALASGSSGNVLRAVWLGHACFVLDVQGVRLVTDPVFDERCGPGALLGPKRLLPPAVSLQQLCDLQKDPNKKVSREELKRRGGMGEQQLERTGMRFLNSFPLPLLD